MRQHGFRTLFFSRLALKILIILSLCGLLPMLVVVRHEPEPANERDTLAPELALRRSEAMVWLDERLGEQARWASAHGLLDAVETLLAPEGDKSLAKHVLVDDLQARLQRTRAYETLFVVDRTGTVLAATREEPLEQVLRGRLAAEGEAEQGFICATARSEILGRPTLLAVHAIRDRRDTALAFLVGRVALPELDASFKAPAGRVSLSFWLVDADGGVVVNRSARPNRAAPRDPRPDLTAQDVVYEGALDDSTPVFLIHTPLDPSGASHLVVALAKADVDAPSQYLKRRALRMTLAGVAVVLVAFLWTTRGVLRPILFLSEGARRLGAGDLNVYLPVWGRDDIAALTAMFNEMIRRLREGREAIEDARDELARTNEDLRAANQTLEALAITDGLTGLYNHRHFQDTLEREIRRCDREGRPLSLLMLDIDHFKQFNDRWGHTEGDAALRRVAGAIMRTIRASDSAFRYGGEELAVLLPGCMKEQARDVAEKMRLAVEDSWSRRSAAAPRLTVSVGVATSPEDARVARGLVDAADAALYAAKARGRNCVVMTGAEDTGDLLEI